MKKILIIILVLIIVLLIITGCVEDSIVTHGNSYFEIYMVEDLSTSEIQEKNLEELILSEKPILTDKDLIEYVWSTHKFKVKEDTETAKDFLEAIKIDNVPVSGKPFVVVCENERIYWGCFLPTYLSSQYPPLTPYIMAIITDDSIKIDYVLDEKKDPRDDKRIYNALKKSGKLDDITKGQDISVSEKYQFSTDNINDVSRAIVQGARKDVANRSKYKDAYYAGGYPPKDEGVCTDVVWRALKNAEYDLKALIDKDIKENTHLYPRITGGPDPNIDFRRVKNQVVFFSRFGEVLTNELIPHDPDNLEQWQPGDIVVIHTPEHIGIISDKRNRKGVPYVIHNMGPVPREDDCLESWSKRITGHFRFPKDRSSV